MITLALIGLVGGLITGISPCVLPVLPVIFLTGGTSDRPAAPSRRRPYLIVAGLALSFSLFTLLGTLALSALPLPKDSIRWAGLVALVVLGVAMLLPKVQDLLERPFTWIPQRRVNSERGGFVLGLALGAVYVPCAGPVLAAITVAGATGQIGWQTVVLTVAFAVGTSIPLLAFALAGRGVSERVRAFRTRQRGVRVAAGLVVIGLAVALTFNVTDAIQRAFPDYTSGLNQALDRGGLAKALGSKASESLQQCQEEPANTLQDCGAAPELSGIQQWLNTPGNAPLTLASLKGKVTLIDFWAYSCINCQRAIAHVAAWYSDYQADGFDVIGVHTPEYAFEHVPANVEAGAKRLGITYPVALDNNYTTWNSFDNQSWPADYLIDSTGQIRHVAIGEGDYSTNESLIRQLLTAANPSVVLPSPTDVADTTPTSPDQTPETYLGSERASTFVGPMLRPGDQTFSYADSLPANEFALSGPWSVTAESITATKAASIELNFDASDVYLDVGGTGTATVEVNGKQSMYQVSGAPNIYTVFHSSADTQATMQVTLSVGLTAYSFTFG